MSDEEGVQEHPLDPDRLEGVAHPRETQQLLGHRAAEEAFLSAWRTGRLHHAWLLAGPRGVGKATFAYRAALFLLAQPAPGAMGLFGAEEGPENFNIPATHPEARQLVAGGHPRMAELRRAWNPSTKSFRKNIAVDDVRKMISFFQLSSAEGGWRVALVDPADELNTAAANALLKVIEEPPSRTVVFLASHAPGKLPPTIRSRCRKLNFRQIGATDAAKAMQTAWPELNPETARRLALLYPGAPGEGLRLAALCEEDPYDEVLELLQSLPRIDRTKLGLMMRSVAGRGNAERFKFLTELITRCVERMALHGAGAPPQPVSEAEARLFANNAGGPRGAQIWAEAAVKLSRRFEGALSLNLDPSRTILDSALLIEETRARVARETN